MNREPQQTPNDGGPQGPPGTETGESAQMRSDAPLSPPPGGPFGRRATALRRIGQR